MKARTLFKPKLLMAMLLALAAAPAMADPAAYGPFGPAPGKIAQFSPEERRAMRERWEQAGPEERLQIRREFQERQERMRQMPAEGRRDMMGPMRNLPGVERDRPRSQREAYGPRGEYPDEGSFGMGFERRRFDGGRVETPAPVPNPGEFFERRHNRDGNRPRMTNPE
jgi:hypothetical protein